MKELVEVIAKSLVENPDEVVVTETEKEDAIIVELKVGPADMGKVIGRQGRIAKAIILSMTPKERSNPGILNPSRKNRIARGAGVDITEVNRLVKQFEQSRKLMKQMPGMMGGKMGKRGGFKLPF